jgi:propanol-preferring alcohol dehydrogenase
MEELTVKAVLLENPGPVEGQPLRITDVDLPEPGLGQLLVKVSACGVCRSNLHMVEGDWLPGNPAFTPIIPGHELVGTVSAVGSGVTAFVTGDRVGVMPLWSTCMRCEFCMTGREQLCQSKQITGETVHGGYAEYVLATADHTYVVPENLGDAEAAPLFCPGITAYGSVSKAQLSPTRSVAVFGIGGVGHVVLQMAALHGGEVVAVTRSEQHRELALEVGATRVVDATRGDPGELLAKQGGVEATIVFAPSDASVRQALTATKPGGTVIVGVNASLGALPFADEKTVVGSLLGSRFEMQEVLRLASEGKLRTVTETYDLDQAHDVLRRLKEGRVRARAVLLV